MIAIQQEIVPVSGGTRVGIRVEPGSDPRGSVVLCHALFEERKSSARVMVNAARALASAGWQTFAFDYGGCGDSPGDQEDFSVPDWHRDLLDMIGHARSTAPEAPVLLLGLRAGAALALRAAREDGAIRALLLWEPVASGIDYLRQELRKKLMKEMITFGHSRVSREALIGRLEAGQDIDLDGYPFTSRLYRDLPLLDIPPSWESPPPPSLVLSVTAHGDSSADATRVVRGLREAGGDVESRGVRDAPFWNLVGTVDGQPVLDETLAWLRAKGLA